MRFEINRCERYLPNKDIEACGLFGVMNIKGERFGGEMAIKAISNMKARGNGLGGGFAVYGIYPEYKDYYALHIMYQDGNLDAKKKVDEFLSKNFDIVHDEEIPTNPSADVSYPPLVWRYFVAPKNTEEKLSDDDFVVEKVMHINTRIEDAYVFSSGKDMGVFKGVGFPEDVADFFMLDELYKGYMWTAHSRFPTNTPGWWGGAHPFSILDWTVVHNGEISSYGTNRRYLEMFGYYCTLFTDTEVMAYAVDLLMRRQGLPIEIVSKIFAAPMWDQIEHMEEKKKKLYTTLRMVYAPLLINGPFTVIVAHHGEMFGITDRIRLRPITAGAKGDFVFLSSEEAGIRAVSPDLDMVWTPRGGEPVVVRLNRKDHLKSLKESI
ncbi:glutamate synthase (NADPH) GltB1 subunit [Archaeoglobus sulfaticallidus PM70-1]|uniref:Glutamate synthase (NADPH) GltB1 subunit n=1 Tax=Archaeoglobus sulfaticallidus PM70-1 TaxID=387631 RepID=N0BAN3_9EURY|nr:glutamine amidotransferase family protein [Archaeoglobus sulfaticallidus]AGK60048.1 glutamate synthase (NADPH) GltB1 subunit [Archaeoglobus sulfaticallidus PM70-1]